MTPLVLIAFLAASVPEVAPTRLDAARAIERARYSFVIGATQPFEEAHPVAALERQVARELAEERVLREAFGLAATPSLVAGECDRIEKTNHAPEQWQAIQAALAHDRGRIEEAFCRPSLVERTLQARFAFDPQIHAETHVRARRARGLFLAGETPPGAVRLVLSRRSMPEVSTEALLQQARAEAAGARVLRSSDDALTKTPIALHPEAAAALEAQLGRPGDVSTVLAEWDRFSVYRLVARTDDTWTVEAVTVPKRDFESWFLEVAGPVTGTSR
jgi:hypothetical protein